MVRWGQQICNIVPNCRCESCTWDDSLSSVGCHVLNGIPKREIQTPTRALVHVIVVISLKGISLGHRVVLSTIVRR